MTNPIADITGTILDLASWTAPAAQFTDSGIFAMVMTRTDARFDDPTTDRPWSAAGANPAPRAIERSRVSEVGDHSGQASGLGPLPAEATPIERLERALRAAGGPLENLSLPPEAAPSLENLLVRSGYTQETARLIVNRSTDEAGDINLGTLFRVMRQYQPSQGPVLALSVNDKPLLIQTLQELGLDPQKVRQYIESLPQDGNYLVISGLKDLVAQAEAKSQEVDPAVLRDLLTRLGLSRQEADALMFKTADNQGRLNGKALLAMLKAAAAAQGDALTKSLQALARQVRTGGASGQQDAARLKARVQEMLARRSTTEAKAQDPAQLIAEAKNLGVDPRQLRARVRNHQAEHAGLKNSAGKTNAPNQAFKEMIQAAESGDPALPKYIDRLGRAATGESATRLAGRAAATARPVTGIESDSRAQGETLGQGATEAAAGGLKGSAGVGGGRGALPSYLVRQVSAQVARMVKSGQSVMRLQLKPAHLGRLNLRLEVVGSTVKATVVAETAAAKSLLESGLAQLKDQLALAGLKVERFDIAVDPDAQRGQQAGAGRDPAGGGRGRHRRRTLGLAQADEPPTPAAAATTYYQGRLSVFA